MSKPCLESLVQLPDVLCQEEDDLYHSAKEACGSDLAARVHNGAGRYSLSFFFFRVYFCVAIRGEAVVAFVLPTCLSVCPFKNCCTDVLNVHFYAVCLLYLLLVL